MKNAGPYGIPQIAMSEGMTVQEYAFKRMRNAILVGALRPGTSLTLRGLADELDLSQTPIREAVRRLSSEHAIQVLGNRRLKVPEMTAGRFEELVQLRIVLEVHAAERALPYISAVITDELTEIDDEMDRAVASGDLHRLAVLNYDFHRTLYRQNPELAVLPLIESVWLQLGPFHRQVIENLEEFYVIDRHKELLTALRSHDVSGLAAAVENDIRDGIVRSGRMMLRQRHSGGEAAEP